MNCFLCEFKTLTINMKTNYERPEAEELNLILENIILYGNTEDPDDPGQEIEL